MAEGESYRPPFERTESKFTGFGKFCYKLGQSLSKSQVTNLATVLEFDVATKEAVEKNEQPGQKLVDFMVDRGIIGENDISQLIETFRVIDADGTAGKVATLFDSCMRTTVRGKSEGSDATAGTTNKRYEGKDDRRTVSGTDVRPYSTGNIDSNSKHMAGRTEKRHESGDDRRNEPGTDVRPYSTGDINDNLQPDELNGSHIEAHSLPRGLTSNENEYLQPDVLSDSHLGAHNRSKKTTSTNHQYVRPDELNGIHMEAHSLPRGLTPTENEYLQPNELNDHYMGAHSPPRGLISNDYIQTYTLPRPSRGAQQSTQSGLSFTNNTYCNLATSARPASAPVDKFVKFKTMNIVSPGYTVTSLIATPNKDAVAIGMRKVGESKASVKTVNLDGSGEATRKFKHVDSGLSSSTPVLVAAIDDKTVLMGWNKTIYRVVVAENTDADPRVVKHILEENAAISCLAVESGTKRVAFGNNLTEDVYICNFQMELLSLPSLQPTCPHPAVSVLFWRGNLLTVGEGGPVNLVDGQGRTMATFCDLRPDSKPVAADICDDVAYILWRKPGSPSFIRCYSLREARELGVSFKVPDQTEFFALVPSALDHRVLVTCTREGELSVYHK